MFDYKKHKSLNEAVLNVVNKNHSDSLNESTVSHEDIKDIHSEVDEELKMTETLDSNKYHIDVVKGEFKTYEDGDKKYKYLYDLEKKSGSGSGPMLVTTRDLKKANKIAAKHGGKVLKTNFGTYRIVKEETDLDEQFNNLKEHFDSLIITLINENKVTSTFNIDLLYTVFAEGYNYALDKSTVTADPEVYK
jgi:hypothetical protein